MVGQRTVLELRGFQCIMEDRTPVPRKSLISTRSFGRRVTKKEDIAQALAMHAGKRALMAVMDRINDHYGRDTLRPAAQGPDDAFWRMQRNKMSSHFTMQWSGLAWVK